MFFTSAKERELKSQLATLRADNEDYSDALQAARQEANGLRQQRDTMRETRDENGLNKLSLTVAGLVEDQFAMHHEGGVVQRKAKIQVLIREAMRAMLTGERDWNVWSPHTRTDVGPKIEHGQ